MLYLATGEWIDDPTVYAEDFMKLWEQMVRPSLETLSKMVDDKKMGGVFAGQRRGVVIIDAASHEEVGSILANFQFPISILESSHLECYTTSILSFYCRRDSKAMENLKHSKS